ncbi:MAG TPA: hypothetical protein VMV99_04145 [Rhodanobacter sp.]|nr:hypothetical protein [Rhodanobacter sp.]
MLAMTEMPCREAEDRFASTLRTFHEHARAIASGNAEGDAFSWFLAAEYQWEMEMACEWLVESPASRLSEDDKATLRHFLGGMPEVRQAIIAGRQDAADRTGQAASPEWADWLAIAALPCWNDFTVRTAILLSQLGTPARNDDRFAACR